MGLKYNFPKMSISKGLVKINSDTILVLKGMRQTVLFGTFVVGTHYFVVKGIEFS